MGGRPECSASNMLSSEEPSIDRPGTWTDHRQCAAKDRQNNWHRLIAGACEGDPHLHERDERTHCGSPQACQNKKSQDTSGQFRHNRPNGGDSREQSYPTVEQNDAQDQTLNEKAEARPAIRERRKESLQGTP